MDIINLSLDDIIKRKLVKIPLRELGRKFQGKHGRKFQHHPSQQWRLGANGPRRPRKRLHRGPLRYHGPFRHRSMNHRLGGNWRRDPLPNRIKQNIAFLPKSSVFHRLGWNPSVTIARHRVNIAKDYLIRRDYNYDSMYRIPSLPLGQYRPKFYKPIRRQRPLIDYAERQRNRELYHAWAKERLAESERAKNFSERTDNQLPQYLQRPCNQEVPSQQFNVPSGGQLLAMPNSRQFCSSQLQNPAAFNFAETYAQSRIIGLPEISARREEGNMRLQQKCNEYQEERQRSVSPDGSIIAELSSRRVDDDPFRRPLSRLTLPRPAAPYTSQGGGGGGFWMTGATTSGTQRW